MSVTGSDPFLLRSSLLATVPKQNGFLGSFCRWVSPGGGCGRSAQSALFLWSLQRWFNHKQRAACPAPVLSPGMLTELGETTGRGGAQGHWFAKLSLLNTTEPLARWQFWDTALPAAWLRTTMATSSFLTYPQRERSLE